MGISNSFHGTKLFLNAGLPDVTDYIERLFSYISVFAGLLIILSLLCLLMLFCLLTKDECLQCGANSMCESNDWTHYHQHC
jgi:hypothetical protein